MCGIAGCILKTPIELDRVEATLPLMRRRGPDHQSYKIIQDSGLQVALLSSRLSIIDLHARANQPFTIGDCTLIFNGEIYNYVEVRSRLAQAGVYCETESDTEVLLQAYLTYGPACVEHFEGMWAFAIYDRAQHRLFLSRDRFAEKPLYYVETAHGLYFASEVKFIQSLLGKPLRVNTQQVTRFLVNGYKSLYKGQETFFEAIREVRYATNVLLGPDLQMQFERYWQPRYRPQPMTLQEAIDGLRSRLIESLRLRLRADVPLAFCLSGGVDSAALASIAAKIFNYDVATFSIIDPDERYNERDNIQATIDDLNCRATLISLTHEHTLERLQALVAYHDAPVYTISYYIHAMLAEAIAGNGYRVAFSGTSADELVTGYYDHFNLYLAHMYRTPHYQQALADWQKGMGQVVRNPYLKQPDLFVRNPQFRGHIYLNREQFVGYLRQAFHEDFYEATFTSDSLLRNRMLNELFHEATPVILHEDDLNSMYYSVENRSPYLDVALFEFAYSVPTEHLIQNGYSKYILREALAGILNDQVRLDRRKKGFNASINSLLNLCDTTTLDYMLADGPIFDIVDRERFRRLLMDHVCTEGAGPLPNSMSKFVFSFISAKMFMDQHVG